MHDKQREPLFWILGEDGRTPVATEDMVVWGACFRDFASRQVGHDVAPLRSVTTQFTCVNLAQGGTPLLFETRWSIDTKPFGIALTSTWKEAEEFHQKLCREFGIK